MKSSFIKVILLLFAVSFTFQSCSDEDVAPPDPTAGLTLIAGGYAPGAATKVELYAEQDLFAGYNPLFIALYDSATNTRTEEAEIVLHPLMSMATMSHSCPVENPDAKSVNHFFPAGILFTMPSGDMGTWTLELTVTNILKGRSGRAIFDVVVHPTSPSRLISFVTDNGARYYLGYRFDQKINVGVNPFEVIAFTRDGSQYLPAKNLSIKLTPEMPSMDHGSPNNTDPVHVGGGHYSGKVNFTMTGEWRLNLDLSDGAADLGTKYFDITVQ